jgi:hypothetical protein
MTLLPLLVFLQNLLVHQVTDKLQPPLTALTALFVVAEARGGELPAAGVGARPVGAEPKLRVAQGPGTCLSLAGRFGKAVLRKRSGAPAPRPPHLLVILPARRASCPAQFRAAPFGRRRPVGRA